MTKTTLGFVNYLKLLESMQIYLSKDLNLLTALLFSPGCHIKIEFAPKIEIATNITGLEILLRRIGKSGRTYLELISPNVFSGPWNRN